MERHPIMAGLAIFMAVIVLFIGLGWLFMGNEFFMYKWLAPKQAEVQREVFENSPSYVEGTVQELYNMQYEYEQADPGHKDALASIIIHRADGYGIDKLPNDLRDFVKQLKKARTGTTGMTTTKY